MFQILVVCFIFWVWASRGSVCFFDRLCLVSCVYGLQWKLIFYFSDPVSIEANCSVSAYINFLLNQIFVEGKKNIHKGEKPHAPREPASAQAKH